MEFYDQVKERLIRYAKVDTHSDRSSQTFPTTSNQFDLARMLADEMREMGISEVYLDEKTFYTYGFLLTYQREKEERLVLSPILIRRRMPVEKMSEPGC